MTKRIIGLILAIAAIAVIVIAAIRHKTFPLDISDFQKEMYLTATFTGLFQSGEVGL